MLFGGEKVRSGDVRSVHNWQNRVAHIPATLFPANIKKRCT
jgi:hypothetical protein